MQYHLSYRIPGSNWKTKIFGTDDARSRWVHRMILAHGKVEFKYLDQ